MKNNRPKVLMLGWEFPPIINGGLGVACHDLSSAMSEFADITMVVPKSSPGFKIKNMNLIGINTVDINSLDYTASRKLPFDIHFVPANLDPYYIEDEFHAKNMGSYSGKESLQLGTFDIDNLYGGDVIHKVFQYAEITA